MKNETPWISCSGKESIMTDKLDLRHRVNLTGELKSIIDNDNIEITIRHEHSNVDSVYTISKDFLKAIKECLNKV